MRNKFSGILQKVYGLLMTIAFFGGLMPLFPLIYAIVVGGETGELIAVFIKNQVYPIIIALASVAIVIGLISIYIDGKQSLSVKNLNVSSDSKTTDEGYPIK